MGGADFDIAMTDMLAAGFPVAEHRTSRSRRCAQDQIGFGTPSESSAGNGYVAPAVVQQAVDCLTKGVNCGGYTLRGGTEPNFRGVMTWSINWDRFYSWDFMNNHGAVPERAAVTRRPSRSPSRSGAAAVDCGTAYAAGATGSERLCVVP